MVFPPVCTFFGDTWNSWIAHFFFVILADVITVGSQVNPAVSVAIYLHSWIPFNGLVVRLLGQTLAALLVFPLLSVLTPDYIEISGPEIGEDTSLLQGMKTEFIVMLGLMLLILMATDFIGPPAHRPVIGMGIRGLVIWGTNTGPGMNPMQALGWAWFKGIDNLTASHFLVYWLAPFIGGSIAVIGWQFLNHGKILSKRI
mmetsp:Transcript_1816/g.2478  ORF Transcript_1816/g.2478 Transcript_1816/m.2478 type:complete len:200 (+) Transcript_1816:111-710(+)